MRSALCNGIYQRDGEGPSDDRALWAQAQHVSRLDGALQVNFV